MTHTLFGGLELWTALDAAVVPAGDTTARDGAAWFRIDVGSGAVAQRGYVTARGANLIYPAIGAPQFGPNSAHDKWRSYAERSHSHRAPSHLSVTINLLHAR